MWRNGMNLENVQNVVEGKDNGVAGWCGYNNNNPHNTQYKIFCP
jgi:hypothetical protein